MNTTEAAIVNNLSKEARVAFEKSLLELERLVASNIPFAAFLDAYLRCIAEMYAATAAAIWVWSEDRAGIQLQAQHNCSSLGLTGELDQAHRQLVRYAFGRSRPNPFLVKPFSAPTVRAKASNPTDSFVIFGPVDNQGDIVAVVELFLGPNPARARTARARQSYVLFLKRLIWFLCRRIEKPHRTHVLRRWRRFGALGFDLGQNVSGAVPVLCGKSGKRGNTLKRG